MHTCTLLSTYLFVRLAFDSVLCNTDQCQPLVGLKLIFGALTFACVFTAVLLIRPKLGSLSLLVITLFWLTGGILQLLDSSILDSFLPRTSGEGLRGVTSFSPEPYEYSRMCLIIMVASYIQLVFKQITKHVFLSIFLLCTFQIFALSFSAGGLLIYVILVGLYPFFQLRLKSLVFCIYLFTYASVIILLINLSPLLSGTRAFSLLAIATSGNLDPILTDAGFFVRAFNLPHSLYVGLFHTDGLGIGLVPRPLLSEQLDYSFLGAIAKGFNPSLDVRSHGGFIGYTYNLGISGLLFTLVTLSWIFKRFLYSSRYLIESSRAVYICISLIILSFFDGTLSNAAIPFLYGLASSNVSAPFKRV